MMSPHVIDLKTSIHIDARTVPPGGGVGGRGAGGARTGEEWVVEQGNTTLPP